jgi:Xaa-Pro aminopeptidase
VDFASRLDRLRERLGDVGVDAALVSHRENIAYLTGFDGSAGWLVVTGDQGVLFTDSRYTLQAEEQAHEVEVQTPKNGIHVGAGKWIDELRGRPTIAFEAGEMSVSEIEKFRPRLARAALVPELGLVERIRQVKDADELAVLKRAVELCDHAYQKVVETAAPGVAERDLALELEYVVRRAGGRESFSTIALAGPRSAMPHGQPSDCRLKEGDFLKIDCGARVDGYCSDMTRTVVIGEPREERQKEVYKAVLAALIGATEAIRPGVEGKEVDDVARKAICDAGFEEHCYDHGLGHGVGRQVHEGPRMGKNAEDVLEAGMVVTVEPGIYIEGFGGVRTEDIICVTEDGCEVLTQTPKPDELPCVG